MKRSIIHSLLFITLILTLTTCEGCVKKSAKKVAEIGLKAAEGMVEAIDEDGEKLAEKTTDAAGKLVKGIGKSLDKQLALSYEGSLPAWQEGYLDIHQISTGRGEAALLVMPDGTTMLIDAGDLGDVGVFEQEIMPAVPNESKRPAEWIARYVTHFSAPTLNEGKIDYALVTHFHSDHMGIPDKVSLTESGLDFKLSGITHVGELLDITTLVDRGYPSYDYPSATNLKEDLGDVLTNYKSFIDHRVSQGKDVEKFSVGTTKQFVLRHNPGAYSDFEIRNIYANGMKWTGKGNGVEQIFPDAEQVAQVRNENMYCTVIRLQYGEFTYYTGGDVFGKPHPDTPWQDVESAIADVVGPVDVVVANHHAYSDAMFDNFIQATRPQVFIIPVWDYYHPQPEPLARMLSKSLYPGERMVFAAGMVKSNRERLATDGEAVKPDGHVVVRVYPGGDEFQVFVLNDRSEKYEVLYQTDKLSSK